MLTVKNLVKSYRSKGGVVTKALDDVSIEFPETGMVFLLGKSGSGKSTLLNMIGGLDRPDSGEVIVKGKSSKNFSTRDFDSYRNTFIGFIFQEYNILNEFNVEQNIALALQLQGKKANKEAIAKLLKEVDLSGLEKRKPNTLSGGQKQRIAIARALIKSPRIIMADEPTGALDSNTGKQVFDTLKKLSKEKLVIIVSHDREFAQLYGDRIVELKDGKIISDETKVYKEAKKISENVNLINNNVIQIKNASKLSAKDNKAILTALKSQKGEVLISGGNNEIINVKKALKINSSGKSETFDTTKKVEVKQYNGEETKFIKSRMPFWRAFKIGVSGLKLKPIRLVATILLSTVAFGMFGIVSTLMFYDSNYSIREAMNKVDYKTETINKKYKYRSQSIVLNYETGKTTVKSTSNEEKSKTLFGVKELESLNKNSAGLKFAGTFDFSGTRYGGDNSFAIDGLNITSDAKDYFNSSLITFSGFSDCGEEYMNSQNFTNCYGGSYPDEVNEIAISDYMGYAILDANVLKDTTIVDLKDLVDKKITVSGRGGKGYTFKEELTIVGVYHIADIPATYNSLKSARDSGTQSEKERETLIEKMSNFINGGFFRTAFVSDGFYDAHADLVPTPSLQSYIPNINLKGIRFNSTYPDDYDVSPDEWASAYDFDYVKDSSDIQYYDIQTDEKVDVQDIELKDGDAIVDPQTYNQFLRSSIGKFGNVRTLFEDMYWKVYGISSYIDGGTKTEIEDLYKSDDYNKIFCGQLDKWDGSFDDSFYSVYNNVKNCLNAHYQEVQFINFARELHGAEIINYVESREQLQGPYWSDAKTSLQKFNNSTPLDSTDITNIDAYLNNKIDALGASNPKFFIPLFKYIGDKLATSAANQFYRKVYGTDGVGGYQQLVNELSDTNIPEEFKTATKELSGFVYDKAIDLDNKESYYPADCAMFKPRYNYKSYYFYKTGSSEDTIHTLNVQYYYKSNDNYSSTPIVNRALIKNYIRDKNIWLSNIVTKYEIPEDAKYNNLMTVSNYSDGQIKVMMENHGSYLYEMTNATYQQITIMINLINQLKQIFMYVGIGTGVLAALLLANFISVSISNKKKDIGILRAVGAKSGDVFKVFWSESGVIALICFTLATIGSAITCNALNNILAGTIISIKVLNFSLMNILIILGASLLISLLATLIPVIRAAKKPPVEAIRAL